MSGFRERIAEIEARLPPGDIVVWQFDAPSDVVGLIAALTEGYDHILLLRSNASGGADHFAIWAAPDYEDDVHHLLEILSNKYGFDMVAPHPFGPDDMKFGMKKRDTC
ncbi:MAG: hypothetical protein GY771_04825 [bacterium]|nr:hypothetical protein [bacterium]